MRRNRTSRWNFTPTGWIKLTRKDAPGAVLYFKLEANGDTLLTAFKGKAAKPAFRYRFPGSWGGPTPNLYGKDFFDSVAEAAKARALRKGIQADGVNCTPFKVGDVLAYSWGYEQTNYDFYQIVKRTARSVTIRPLKKDVQAIGDMHAKERPLVNQFHGEKRMQKTESFSPDGRPYLSMEFGIARVIDPTKTHTSTSYA